MAGSCRIPRPSARLHSCAGELKPWLIPTFNKRPSGLDAGKDLLRRGYGKGEHNLRQAILVFGVGVLDVGFGFLEFGLREFDDGTETEIVTRLRQSEREAGLLAQLLSYGEPFESAAGILPGVAHVAGDVVARVEQALTLDFALEV